MSEAQTKPFDPLDYPLAMSDPLWVTDGSSWVSHIPFAMSLVQMIRPRTYVELGTFKGDSYCAFCQAIAELKLDTKCWAVDTWRGDAHAGTLSEQSLAALRQHHDPRYSAFSTLLQMDFDSALPKFADGSIDLLHIDGLHTYEAVKHDFESWRGKVSERGVVLFHDTDCRERDFGVWRLWEEASRDRPHYEFKHGFGLGVLALGEQVPPALLAFLEAVAKRAEIARFYFCLGHRINLYKLSSITIMGLHQTHAFAESILGAQQPLPHPIGDPVAFVNRILSELNGVAELHRARRG